MANQTFTMTAGDIEADGNIDFKTPAGAVVDISGYTSIIWQIFPYVNGQIGTAVLTKSLGNGLEFTTDGTDGLLDFELSDTETADLDGQYYMEMRVVTGAAKEFVVMKGTANFLFDPFAV